MATNLNHLGIGFAEDSRKSLLLDDRFDIATTLTPLDNFSNCIWRRLMTPLGFYPEYPDYGSQLHELIGMGFVPEIVNFAEIFITQCLVKEPRVDTINSVRIVPTDYRSLMFYVSLKPAETSNVYIMTFDYFLGA